MCVSRWKIRVNFGCTRSARGLVKLEARLLRLEERLSSDPEAPLGLVASRVHAPPAPFRCSGHPQRASERAGGRPARQGDVYVTNGLIGGHHLEWTRSA